jgi:hypothetical protein
MNLRVGLHASIFDVFSKHPIHPAEMNSLGHCCEMKFATFLVQLL